MNLTGSGGTPTFTLCSSVPNARLARLQAAFDPAPAHQGQTAFFTTFCPFKGRDVLTVTF